jgi:hypothetical protein
VCASDECAIERPVSTARFVCTAGLVGGVVSLVLTHPLVLAAGTTVLDDGTLDAYQFLWNLWWARESLLHLGTSPFTTDYLYYPAGVGLLFHTLSLSLGIASIPLQLVLPGGVVPAHNALVLAAPAAVVVAVGLLAREVCRDDAAALAGGLAAALSAVAVWFLPVLYLDCWYLVPLVVWAWWRMQATRRPTWVAAALGLVAFTVFASQEYAMMALGILALDTLARLVAPRVLGLAPAWGAGTAAFWTASAAGLGALAVLAAGGDAALPPPRQVRWASAYALGFVTPPWLVAPGKPFWTIIYVGTAPLLLAAAALPLARRAAVFWAILLVVLLSLAMGPYLHLVHPLGWGIDRPADVLDAGGVPGPYLIGTSLVPVLRFFRAPYRWMVAVQIAAGVLAALAVAALRARATHDGGRRLLTLAIIAFVVGAGALDVRGLRAPIVEARIPPAYAPLITDPEPSAVLELPSGIGASFALLSSRWMFYQTAHRKFLLEGTVSRLPPGYHPVVEREIRDFAELPYVKYVLIHRDVLQATLPESRRQVDAVERLLARQGERLPSLGAIELWRLRTFRPESVVR